MEYRKKATIKVICSESKGKMNFSIDYTSNVDRDDFKKMTIEEQKKHFKEEGFLLENKEAKMIEIANVLKASLEEYFKNDLDKNIAIKTRVFGLK